MELIDFFFLAESSGSQARDSLFGLSIIKEEPIDQDDYTFDDDCGSEEFVLYDDGCNDDFGDDSIIGKLKIFYNLYEHIILYQLNCFL